MCVPPAQYENAVARLGGTDNICIIEMTNNDSWMRDTGATFLVNDKGGLRAVDWDFNAYGGLVDGLYFPWDQDSMIARKMCEQTDAKGRRLKVHKLCVTKEPCYLKDADTIDYAEGAIPRKEGEVSIASYLNFLIVNGAIILPQYGDENDQLAVEQIKKVFPGYKVEGVLTTEVAYGGGNIHCITQQQPKVR